MTCTPKRPRAAQRIAPAPRLRGLITDANDALEVLSFLYWSTIPEAATTDDARADEDLDIRLTATEYARLRFAVITAQEKMKVLVASFDRASHVEK